MSSMQVGQISVGTGGTAPNIYDLNLEKYRPSEFQDLYDAARVADTLEHLHFSRDAVEGKNYAVQACRCGISGHSGTVVSSGCHHDS